MTLRRLLGLALLLGLIGCDSGGGTDAGPSGTDAAVGADGGAPMDAGAVDGGASDAGASDAGGPTDAGIPDCFDFSDDPDVPLAIDGAFSATSETWRRPHDDEPVCPATALLPDTAAAVPFVVYAFCNRDTVEHTYDIEWLAQDGPGGEPPLDDPYLILYEGQGIPADARQCLAVNDDIPMAIDTSDSEILGVVVPAGGALTVVGTTYTFDPTDGTGTGGYIMVVTNAD